MTACHCATYFACSMRAESRKVEVLHNYRPKLKSSMEVGTMAASSGCSGKALVPPAICCVVDVIVDSASPGGKEMSLTGERELEVIRGGLTTVTNPNGTPGRRTLLLCHV